MKPILSIQSIICTCIAIAVASCTFFDPGSIEAAVNALPYLSGIDLNTLVGGGALTAMQFPIASSAKAAKREVIFQEGYLFNKPPNPNEVTEHYLRLEEVVDNQTNRYSFNPSKQENKDPNTVTENAIRENDAFIVTGLGVYIAVVDTDRPAAFVPYTYPNPQRFGILGGTNVDDWYQLYNGQLYIKTGREELRAVNMLNFLYQPETQKDSADNVDKLVYPYHGFMEQVPMKVLSGEAEHRIDITFNTHPGNAIAFNSGSTAAEIDNGETRIIVVCEGFNVFNGAKA